MTLKRLQQLVPRIEWSNFLFILFTPIVGISGTIWVVTNGGPHWGTLLLLGSLMLLTGLGVTAGYHRLFTHCSYKAHWSVRLLLLLLGGAAWEGAAREWCCAHRKHHRHVDQEGDPYNITKGFWHAHVLWVILKSDQSDESNIQDLLKDPLIRFQSKYYIPLAALIGFALPTTLASLWGDPWGGFFVAGVLRVVINHHLTFLINSYCHYFGRQTYSDKDTARDSTLMAFFTYGEGYHNFHHAFQSDFRNGFRVYHFDPTKWFILLLAKLGLVAHLHRVHPDRILQAKLAMDEKRLRRRAELKGMIAEEWEQLVARTRRKIESAHARLIELSVEYQRLKKENAESLQNKLDEIKREIDRLRTEYHEGMERWTLLLKGVSVTTA